MKTLDIAEPGYENNFFGELELKHSNIWIGDGQTLGKLHFDEFENALAMIRGSKGVRVTSQDMLNFY